MTVFLRPWGRSNRPENGLGGIWREFQSMSMRVRWREFELPSRVDCDQETRAENYGKFVIEPFERGFGHTVGNSLRRVLLSSIEGAALVQARVHI